VLVKEATVSRFVVLLGVILMAVGCASQQVRPPAPDPLVGDIPGTLSPAPPEKGSGEFIGKPVDPPTSTPTSMAEITAGNAGVTLGSPRATEAKALPREALEGLPGIGAPEQTSPPVPPNHANSLTPAPGPTSPSGGIISTVATEETVPPVKLTYENMQKRLRELGVVWQQLQNTGHDKWHFICAVADPTTPGIRENFEVTREGEMGLLAIQAAIEQIEKSQRASPPPQAYQHGTASDR
jgi:hypothetical protein